MHLDRKNGDTMWADAHVDEMKTVGVTFEVLPGGTKAPHGWTKSSGHLIWDVKMDFTYKARWAKDGPHQTPNPKSSTYAEVVSREII